jgi:6-phosphogluconolactonase
VHHQIRVFASDDLVATAAADFVVERARQAVATKDAFHFAVSGGRSPWAMFADLPSRDIPWRQTVIYQVDERVAQRGDPTRNLTNLVDALGGVAPRIELMPVDDDDLDAGAVHYGALLPERLDLVHLGLGPDAHSASLIARDPVLEVSNRLVAITGEYQGRRRMTLTYDALAPADQLLWLVTGSNKRDALSLLLVGDVSIPAGRVEAARSLIMADRSAMGS